MLAPPLPADRLPAACGPAVEVERPDADASLGAWLEWQDGLSDSAIDLGLERCREIQERLKLDRLPFVVVTVAGTNGKGSSVAALGQVFTDAGYRTGTYFSPWLLRFNEIAQVNGEPLTDEQFIRSFVAVEAARGAVALTAFEFQTLAVAHRFSQADLDVAVFEIGLGGARDAVNVFDADYALLTSIGIDHTDWLGATRDSVASEKTGIFRPGQTAVVGDPSPPPLVARRAVELGVSCSFRGPDFDVVEREDGRWQWLAQGGRAMDLPDEAVFESASSRDNAAAVLMVLECMHDRIATDPARRAEAVVRGFSGMPGRQHRLGGRPERWVDVAHNPDAGSALARVLADNPVPGRTLCVLAMLGDKDAGGFVDSMANAVDVWYLADNPDPRGDRAAALEARCADRLEGNYRVCGSIQEAWARALADAGQHDRVIATGSFACARTVLRMNSSMDVQ